MKKFLFGTTAILILTSLAIIFVVLPVIVANAIPNEIKLTTHEFSQEQPIYLPRSHFVTQTTNSESAVGEDAERYVDIKLFGIIPIRRIKVDILPFDEVYAGGQVMGFMAKIDGVLVTQDAPEYKIKKGDIIKQVNGEAIGSVAEFEKVLADVGDGNQLNLDVQIDRTGKLKNVRIVKEFDISQPPSALLGLWLKDETSGVGTLTYINPQNNNFASLGHRLSDFETAVNVDLRGGGVHKINILSIEKSERKKVGSFKSAIQSASSNSAQSQQGDILSSNFSGVFGCLKAENSLADLTKKYPVSSRYNVRPGKAKLRTTINGEEVREFDIEIVKTKFQSKPSTKSMVIRVTDKELLEATGGIIHGMSGSPIIQNGNVVGALTHVVLGDTSKGYGIYIDFVVP